MSDLDLSLPHLDFEREGLRPALQSKDFLKSVCLSSQETTRSSSFHSLLSQNEDLAARLRVTLQRLATTEDENSKLSEQLESIQGQFNAIKDQLLIWREKERIWKARELQLEKQQKDREMELEIESSLLRQKAEQFDKIEEKLGRYQKYQEKIKSSVKPYIAQLKGYAESLLEQTRTLNHSIVQKEMLIQDLETKLRKARAEVDTVGAKFQNEKNQLISLFEDERESLRQHLDGLQLQNETLVEKTRVLERSLERQDELENLVVALRRTKEDQGIKFQKETEELRQLQRKTESDLTTQNMSHQDLQKEFTALKESYSSLSEAQSQAQEQLVSLRYMWTQKTQECEKLKLTSLSLEKINHELSQKLNSLRKDMDIS